MAAVDCRRKFLRFFKKGFADPTYLDWERDYKAEAHGRWDDALNESAYKALLMSEAYDEIAARAVRIESRTNLLFSFEKMALRDAVKSQAGARAFAHGLYDFLHGRADPEARFVQWCEAVATLPRRQTRVLTWPVLTVFGSSPSRERTYFSSRSSRASPREPTDSTFDTPRARLADLREPARLRGAVSRDVRDLARAT